MLLVNKDPAHPHDVSVVFRDRQVRTDRYFRGPITALTFGEAQYRWHPNGPNGFANPDGPEVSHSVAGGKNTVYALPGGSITVLSGSVR